MRTRWLCCTIAPAVLILAFGPSWGQVSATDRDRAKADVEKDFGAEIRRARASADKSDDVKVAGALLAASDNARAPAATRAELARTAMEILAGVGTPVSAGQAEAALNQWAAIAKPSPVERAEVVASLRQSLLDSARADRRKELTGQLAEAVGDLAKAYQQQDDLDNAAAHIVRAIGLARSVGLTDQAERLNEVNQRIQQVRSFRRDLDEAKRELAAAVAGNNPPLVKAAWEKIGMLHLLRMGDAVSAAEALDKAGHEWGGPARLLVRRKQGGRLTGEQGIAVAEMLRDAAMKAELLARAPLLETLLEVCTEAKSRLPADSERIAQVDTLCNLARTMLDRLPNSKKNLARRALESLAATVRFNADGSIQITYNFASDRQLEDFTQVGQWQVRSGRLMGKDASSALYHNVRLRADKPLQVTLMASGAGGGALCLAVNDALTDYGNNPHLTLYASQKRWTLSGLGFPRAGASDLGDPPYAVQVLSDGAGNFTYTINRKPVATVKARTDLSKAHLRLGVDLARGGAFAFYDIAIRGTPVEEDPVAKGDQQPQPIPQPQPPQPPQRPQPPRRPRGGGG